MKKVLIISLGLLTMMSSCGTYEASGAATGAYFGSIIGSAIGGITGGWRGSDVGSLIGMAGGAAVGAAVGKAADEKAQQRYEEYDKRTANRRSNKKWDDNNYDRTYHNDSGYDPTNSGDDRIMLDGMSEPSAIPLELRNIKVLDQNRDGVIARGEACRVVLEIYNPTDQMAVGVRPIVAEVTGNRHIFISENVLIESIAPKQTMRYTAMMKTDNRLKDGQVVIRVSLHQAGKELRSQTKEFRLRTSKR